MVNVTSSYVKPEPKPVGKPQVIKPEVKEEPKVVEVSLKPSVKPKAPELPNTGEGDMQATGLVGLSLILASITGTSVYRNRKKREKKG